MFVRSRLTAAGSMAVLALSLLGGACRAVLDIDADRPILDANADAADAAASTNRVEDSGTAASALRFCSTVVPRPDFCADFEDDTVATGWLNATASPDPGMMGGGSIAPQTLEPYSGARAAKFSIPPLLTDSNEASAFLFAYLPKGAQKLMVDLAVRIDTEAFVPDGGALAILFSLEFGRDVGRIWILRSGKGMTLAVFDGPRSSETQAFSAPFPVGQWKTIKLLLSNYPRDGAKGEVEVLVDGPVASLPVPASYQDANIRPQLHVGTGLARGPMGEFRVSVDDVRARVIP